MKKAILLFLFPLLVSTLGLAQPAEQVLQKDSLLIDITEKLILFNELDSAKKVLSQISPNTRVDYTDILLRLSNSEEVSYADYNRFIKQQAGFSDENPQVFLDYVNRHIAEPKEEKVNLDYVMIQWYLMTNLRNAGDIPATTELHTALEKYIQQFDPEDHQTIRAQILANTNLIVLAQIQGDFSKSKELCSQDEAQARLINDTNQIIGTLFHLSACYLEEKDLEGYISVNEKSHQLDLEFNKQSNYYPSVLQNLINAYSFKGGHEEKVWELLSELYLLRKSHAGSYSLHAQFLHDLPEGSPYQQKVFDRFKVNNVIDFGHTLIELTENKVDPIHYFHVLNELSKLLERHEHFNEALRMKDRAITQTRKTYSEDLSKSLANFETRQAVKLKQVEVENERDKAKLEHDKANLYIVIASLVGGMLFLVLFALIRKSKQAKELEETGRKLVLQRDEITEREAEKALLLKEVHHRVKNNFQIVSSLLELQSKGIEDVKARELAEEGKNRVKSMAFIHQRLYQNDDLLIYFDEYIDKLVAEIASMYGSKSKAQISLNVPKVGFDVDTAIPLGLIINELVTNAFKYGFEVDNERLDISISRADESTYQLVVKDNGKGMLPNFDIGKAKSLGLRLVRRLSKQLQGGVSYANEGGAVFTVFFKDTSARAEIQ